MVLKTIEKIRGGIRGALTAGEDIAERLALAEIDQVIQARVSAILIPTVIVAALFALLEAAAALINDTEMLRLAVTTILLAAGLYGTWALVDGFIALLPVLSVWAATRLGPHGFARLLLYHLILRQLRETFTGTEGEATIAGRIAGYAMKFSGHAPDWETLAYRVADRIAPRLVRHGLVQTLLVLGPTAAAWAYYRFKLFPDLVRAETGLGFWSAFAYPIAALVDWIAGTDLRAALLLG
jgi:hypothetical protein